MTTKLVTDPILEKNNMEDSNCCPPNQNANSTCCQKSLPSEADDKMGMKKKIGMFLMGAALVIGISSAFKTATDSNSCSPTECSTSKACTSTQNTSCCVKK